MIVEGEVTHEGTTIRSSHSQEDSISLPDGTFQIEISGLVNGINYVKFNSTFGGKVSADVERIVYRTDEDIFSFNTLANVINVEIGDTKDKNLYVSGTASGGDYVYVNGVKTKVLNGEYAAFVLINHGENVIKVEGSGEPQTATVYYNKENFKFKRLDLFSSIFSNPQITINGETNIDVPFSVYLNGNFIEEINPTNNVFDINLNLDKQKNYLTLIGPNGETLERLLYLDTSAPEIEVVTADELAVGSEFVFKISDDIGYDFDTISLEINEKVYSTNNLNVKGDYYSLKLENMQPGVKNYNISVSDKGSQLTLKGGTFTLNEKPYLKKILFIGDEDAFKFGNIIYTKSGNYDLDLEFSENVAFKKILIDGKEFIDYEIDSNGGITFSMNVNKDYSLINFTYIDGSKDETGNYIEYSDSLEVYTDKEKPLLELDYVNKPIFSDENIIVSGKISDSNFRWDSLDINGIQPFKYGDNFEAYLTKEDVKGGFLTITGSDYYGNNLEIKNGAGDLLPIVDTSGEPSITFRDNDYINSVFEIIINNGDLENQVYNLNYYDGMELGNSFISKGMNLPLSQRAGLRPIAFETADLGGKKYISNNVLKVDYISPQIYFVDYNETSKQLEVIIDGTLTEPTSASLLATQNGVNIDEISTVDDYDKKGINDVMYRFGNINDGDVIIIETADEAGNKNIREFTIGTDVLDRNDYSQNLPEVFLNQVYADDGKIYFSGNIKSENVISNFNVKNNNGVYKSCIFDDISFYCSVDISGDENNIMLVPEAYNSRDTSTSCIDENVDCFNFTFLIDEKTVSSGASVKEEPRIFSIGGVYYINQNTAQIDVDNSINSITAITINNKEFLIGDIEQTTINFDLGDFLFSGKQKLKINAKSKDSDVIQQSEDVEGYLLKIFETLVDIKVR
jgi:hypothetical protein